MVLRQLGSPRRPRGLLRFGACIFWRFYEFVAQLETVTIYLWRVNVRKLLAIAALAALGMSTAAAQSSWTAELGIQGGFAKVKPAGTGANDAINLFDIPGGSFLYSTLG